MKWDNRRDLNELVRVKIEDLVYEEVFVGSMDKKRKRDSMYSIKVNEIKEESIESDKVEE